MDDVKEKKPWYKQRRIIIGLIIALIIMLIFPELMFGLGCIIFFGSIIGVFVAKARKMKLDPVFKVMTLGLGMMFLGAVLMPQPSEMTVVEETIKEEYNANNFKEETENDDETINENAEEEIKENVQENEKEEEIKEEIEQKTEPVKQETIPEVTLEELKEQQMTQNLSKLQLILDEIIAAMNGVILDIRANPYTEDWSQAEVIVSDDWYYSPEHEKERFAEMIGNTVKMAIYESGVKTKDEIILVKFYDAHYKELASEKLFGGYKIIR